MYLNPDVQKTFMKQILILGALPKKESDFEKYNSIIEVCNNHSEQVFSPIDTTRFKGGDKERYKRAIKLIKQADLIIGEQSKPSTGQGIEIGYASSLNKDIIVVAETGSKVSGLIKGSPLVKKIIYYSSLNELKEKLEKFLKNF